MKGKDMIVSQAIEKMIAFYKGNIHDIDHFIKVWAYAKAIGELEGLDAHTQEVLELAAVIHDISCPLCREKYGKALGAIRNFLDTCNAAEVVACVKGGGTYKTKLGDTEVEFTIDDLLISSEPSEGFVSESSDGLTVVLDVHVTEELLLEGAVRELVSRIQNMRKEAGFNVTDRIVLGYKAEGVAERVLKEKTDEIKSDVLAEEITETPDGYVKDFDINGDKVVLGVKKI